MPRVVEPRIEEPAREKINRVLEDLQYRGRVVIDVEIPPSQEFWYPHVLPRQKDWVYAFVKSGGNSRIAAEIAHYRTTPSATTAQLLRNGYGNSYIALRWYLIYVHRLFQEAIGRANVDVPLALLVAPEEAVPDVPALPASQAIQTATETALEPEVLPPEDDGKEPVSRALDTLNQTMKARPGDFMRIINTATQEWTWDLHALRNAPPGVVKSLKTDTRGQLQVEFHEAPAAARFVLEHFRPKQQRDSEREDTRTLVVALLQSGDVLQRLKMEDLARNAAQAMKQQREEKSG